ncbi:MAG: hypothetical protein K2X47_06555 [Bdellovibrionales bacterium]|nr:hypothetical protein [Bdellovibrionales bacterium]
MRNWWGMETRWIWIQIGIALFLVVLFMTRGKQAGPSRLRLTHKKRDSKTALSKLTSQKAQVPSTVVIGGQGERPLNVLFNYNGETFDAFEVLGLPAAAPWDLVHQVYQKQFAIKAFAERALYEAAYRAIEASYQGQRMSS